MNYLVLVVVLSLKACNSNYYYYYWHVASIAAITARITTVSITF